MRLSNSLHLLPQLTELTIAKLDHETEDDDDQPTILPTLPATLTYLYLDHSNELLVTSQRTGAEPVELLAALAPSLLCLSLLLPVTVLKDTLLSSLPSRCPQLTHCHVADMTDYDEADHNDDDEEGDEARQDDAWQQKEERAQCAQRLQTLCDRLGEAVWCETVAAVTRQRLEAVATRGGSAGWALLTQGNSYNHAA